MAKRRKQTVHNKAKKKNLIIQDAMNLMVWLYGILVIVMLPLYNEGSYAQIATNKVAFWFAASKWITVGTIVLVVISGLFRFFGEGYQNDKNSNKISNKSQDKCNNKNVGIINDLKQIITNLSATDLFALGYAVILIISYLCSYYKEGAFVGNEGWGTGLYTQFVWLFFYFVISRWYRCSKWLPALFVPVTVVLFVLAYLNRFGIFPIPMGVSDNVQFISLVGNINWLCGYMILPIFGCVCLAWYPFEKGNRKHVLLQCGLYGYLFLAFLVIITNGSSSGILASGLMLFVLLVLSLKKFQGMIAYCHVLALFAIACLFTWCVRKIAPQAITYHEATTDLLTTGEFPFLLSAIVFVFGCLLYLCQKKKYPFFCEKRLPAILLITAGAGMVVFMGMIALNTIKPGILGPLSAHSVFTFTPGWGSLRGATWTAGLWTWAEQDFLHKLIGTGPEGLRGHIYNNASDALLGYVNEIWPVSSNVFLTNAHGEWIQVLVEKGILGLICFVGMIGSAVKRYSMNDGFMVITNNKTTDPNRILMTCCGMAILGYAIHNVVSFQQILNGSTMFFLLGLGEAYHRNLKK